MHILLQFFDAQEKSDELCLSGLLFFYTLLKYLFFSVLKCQEQDYRPTK